MSNDVYALAGAVRAGTLSPQQREQLAHLLYAIDHACKPVPAPPAHLDAAEWRTIYALGRWEPVGAAFAELLQDGGLR